MLNNKSNNRAAQKKDNFGFHTETVDVWISMYGMYGIPDYGRVALRCSKVQCRQVHSLEFTWKWMAWPRKEYHEMVNSTSM